MSNRVRSATALAAVVSFTVLGAFAGPPALAADLSPGSLSPLPTCDGPAPRITPFGDAAAPVLGWRENLVFDGRGRMWVSGMLANEVVAYDPGGRRVASVPIDSPGGLALTPEGEVVVVTGATPTATHSKIFAFDPDSARPAPRLVTTLAPGKNGLAVDAAGNMYTTGLFAPTITKVRADGTVDDAWSATAAVGGTNGIVIRDRTAYVTVTASVDTVVYEIPLSNPIAARPHVLTRLPALARGLDDLAVTDDALYLAGLTGGEILRVDRWTAAPCVLVGGIPGPTSVRVAEGFGGYGPGDLFVTSVDGSIRHVAIGT
ncbi:SMP-30/gluconolactonase/LRE family protein [Dietzia alimentaria]|uniref:SMP-30/gluconolactonase/LRE family protein n=1 Tax=Dietzia alimentaria TaxID=665550 RepID=UPI000299E5C4|nr:hypothetical protein [Dietzia alimentaria]